MEYIKDSDLHYIKEIYGEQRYEHVLNVIEVAFKLGEKYKVDKNKIYAAALLHDIAKGMPVESLVEILDENDIHFDPEYHTVNILHGPAAAVIAYTDFDIEDDDILNAIYNHTFARPEMTMLEKIIFLADATEKDRTYKNVGKIRRAMYKDIDKALEISLSGTVSYVLGKGDILYPVTAEALEYIQQRIYKEKYEFKTNPELLSDTDIPE